MTEWREIVLSDLCDRVTVGHVGKMSGEYVDDGVCFLRSQNVRPFSISHEGMLRISERFHKRLSKSALRTGDVVVVRTGYPGTAAVIPPDLDGANCADLVVITPSDQLNPHVLAAVFNSAWGRSAVSGQLVGSAQQHFNIGSARAMRIRLPARDGQDRIAAILCSLNDLIASNRRRIELLEQMAQAIYREWFVRFRYPGHEDVPLVESPIGPIPAGWKSTTLSALVDVDKGLSYKGAHLTDSGAPMANLKCFRPGGGFRRDGTKPYSGPFKEKHRVAPGDLIMANTDLTQAGSVIGSPAFIPRRGFESGGIISHHLFVIRCRDRSLIPWLYQVFRDERFRSFARGVASGTTVLGFRPADLLSFPLACPPPDAYKRFSDLAADLHAMSQDLDDACDELVAIRDLLLPRLVTGQIDVSELNLAPVDSVA